MYHRPKPIDVEVEVEIEAEIPHSYRSFVQQVSGLTLYTTLLLPSPFPLPPTSNLLNIAHQVIFGANVREP
jgi:hypothetical protein